MNMTPEPQGDYDGILYTVVDGDADSAAEPAYAKPQRQVQRWLGRCMLSLQQSERLLKLLLHVSDVLAVHDGSGKGAAAFDVRRAFDEKQLASMTLGGGVSAFFDAVALQDTEAAGRHGDLPGDRLSIHTRLNISLERDAWQAMQASMREMVALRNEWVHHLIDRFDLCSVAGCAQALAELQTGYDKAERFRKELVGIAKAWEEGQRWLAELFSSPQGLEMLRTGKLPLEGSSVVTALRRALQDCTPADDGSVLLADVLEWLQRHSPDEIPETYGRVSWPQLIHDSGAFSIVRHGADGRRISPRVRLKGGPALAHG